VKLACRNNNLVKMPSTWRHHAVLVIILLVAASMVLHPHHTVVCHPRQSSSFSDMAASPSSSSSSSSSSSESKLALVRARRAGGRRLQAPSSAYNIPGMRDARCQHMGNYTDCMLCGRISDDSRVFFGCCRGESRVLLFCEQLLT
jgi:hypothetical protein